MTTPSMQFDYSQTEEFQNRSRKLAEIRALGMDPYPHKWVQGTKTLKLILESEDKPVGTYEEAAAGETEHVFVSGRLVLFRPMGKNVFAHIQDETGRIQFLFQRDISQVQGLPRDAELSPLKWIEKMIDLGDILGIEGFLFRTQKQELTIFVKKITLLSKSLLPLPDKHGGLADKGVCYRKRWLDLITHPSSMDRFRIRSRLVSAVRRFLEEEAFEEVETPILQNIYGGAEARPFETHLNALDQKMYLRIALEISLKKLLVGGMHRIYEIGKVFRNEGMDRTHNPEFTMLEAYAADWDYFDMMDLVERLFARLSLNLFSSYEVPTPQATLSFATPWKRLSMKESIRVYAGLDVDSMSDQELQAAIGSDIPLIDTRRGILIAKLFDEKVVHQLIQPHHITDHPIETTPLCKPHRDPALRDSGLVERFESFILGQEICNSYTELNDPELQKQLLEQQVAQRLAGNEEAHPLDEEFLEAICQGMPPAAGVGIGIDRLVMLFTSAPSIRDVLFFPMMRPEKD